MQLHDPLLHMWRAFMFVCYFSGGFFLLDFHWLLPVSLKYVPDHLALQTLSMFSDMKTFWKVSSNSFPLTHSPSQTTRSVLLIAFSWSPELEFRFKFWKNGPRYNWLEKNVESTCLQVYHSDPTASTELVVRRMALFSPSVVMSVNHRHVLHYTTGHLTLFRSGFTSLRVSFLGRSN